MRTAEEAGDATLALLALRAQDATVCPSEVARTLADRGVAGLTSEDWRTVMPIVHAAVDRLLADGLVRLSWRGQPLATRAGPYRIQRRARRG